MITVTNIFCVIPQLPVALQNYQMVYCNKYCWFIYFFLNRQMVQYRYPVIIILKILTEILGTGGFSAVFH
jgi:hypothetical protein